MTCPFCKAAPRSDWGYECGTGPDAERQRSVRCRDAEIATLRQRIKHLEDRIDLLMSANADVARIAGERDKAEKRVLYLESALRRIANQDYRGNRSTESQIAVEALKP